MARAQLIAGGIGFSPGSTKWIPTLGMGFAAIPALAGVQLRRQDASNYLRAYVDVSAEKIKLDKVVAGVVTNLAEPAWTPANGEIRAIAQGNRIRVWFNRRLYIDVEDSAFASETDAGAYTKDSTSIRLDNWYGQGV